jgi:heme-degrading monooxygenase HmoA
MVFMLTRINVDDYDEWKQRFDTDAPKARAEAKGHRLLRNADKPNEVFILVEFDSVERAAAGRQKLLASGILDQFEDKTEPKVLEEAEQVSYEIAVSEGFA